MGFGNSANVRGKIKYGEREQCDCTGDLFKQKMPAEVVDYLESIDMPPNVCAYLHDTFNDIMLEEARQAQFVSDVSHEIRTPLTAIRGAAETLAEGDVPHEIAQRFLHQIISE